MDHKACAMHGCPNTIGVIPYKLFKSDAEYCSRACVNDAFNAQSGKREDTSRPCATCAKPVRLDGAMRMPDGRVYHPACPAPAEEKSMKVPATDFGSSGVTRRICDRRACGLPIALGWKGRNGEYCSNQCLKMSEKKDLLTGEDMPDEQNATATAAPSPIAAGAPAPKKTNKKTAAPPKRHSAQQKGP